MKVAVSLPDDLCAWADTYANDNGVTRSALFAKALREYLLKHKDADITQWTNDAIDKYGQPTDDMVISASKRAMRKVQW